MQASTATIQGKIDELTRDLDEARRQQAATANVLKVISRSAFDLQSVLDTLVSSAATLSGAFAGVLALRDGDGLRYRATYGMPEEYRRWLRETPIRAGRGTAMGRVMLTGEADVIRDLLEDKEYVAPAYRLTGTRSMLTVPLVRDGHIEVVFSLNRLEPGDFTQHQIELVQTFADQALIAIENARLFDEAQARTRDLSEALQQQTATADVLKVISRSAFDLQTVLDTLVESAARLCAADKGSIMRRDGDVYRSLATHGYSDELNRYFAAHPLPAGRGSVSGRAGLEGTAVHIPDVLADPEYTAADAQRAADYRTALGVPLMRDGTAIGVLALLRHELNPFTDKQIELVTTFADQAVIAIENARLFDEVQARTRDFSEALQQQTATANVLKVISRSAFDLQAVFDTLISSAVELIGAANGVICVRDGDVFRYRAQCGSAPELMAYLAEHPAKGGQRSSAGRVILSGKVEVVADVLEDRDYVVPVNRIDGTRSILAVPMLRDDAVEGVFSIGRREPGTFTQRQIELLQTFADQAVIAVENARLFGEVQARTRDLSESLEQQTATSNVLEVISRSAFDLHAVFETVAESSVRLCGADRAFIYGFDGKLLRMAVAFNASQDFKDFLDRNPIRPGRHSASARAALERRTVHIHDVLGDPEYSYGAKDAEAIRTVLAVPILKANDLLGVMVIYHLEVRPFTDKQIALLETFADQAAIAIENVRLFDEVQARTRDFAEALQQQTATANVLKVISRSAFDLQAVFDTLINSAVELIGAANGAICLRDGDVFRYRAHSNMAPELVAYLDAHPATPGRGSSVGRVLLSGKVECLPDLLDDADYMLPTHIYNRTRSILAAPLQRNDAVEGVLVIARTQPGDFTQRQIEIVQTFADQAVIAIENVRLLDQVQARTRDLSEALQQQTATTNVLKVISRSAFDLQGVFDTLINSAVELIGAARGWMCLRDGSVFRYRAHFGLAPELVAYFDAHPARPERGSSAGRVILSGKVEAIPDVLEADDYVVPVHRIDGTRSVLAVPMLRNDTVEGVFSVARNEPGHFTERHIELMQTFADQAVIAIENVRLFDEVQARTRDLTAALQQQTATADVLKVISRSAFDLQTVLDTLTRSAIRLCGAKQGIIFLRDGEVYRAEAAAGAGPEYLRFLKDHPRRPGRESICPRVALSGRVEQIPDITQDVDYHFPGAVAISKNRALLGVPMLRDGRVEGVFALGRLEPGLFTERQIELVQTFADQAIIAIENAKLFEQVQARTRELAASLDDLRNAQDRLIQTEKLASLGQLTAGIAHEIKNPLNFVNNFADLSRELIVELTEVIDGAPGGLAQDLRAEVGEITGMLKSNLEKVAQHGRRADSIVKNMLLHSRKGGGERRGVDLNGLVEEALNLAYHGARAEKPGFNITLEKSLDPAVGTVELFPQEFTRVLLNLISNGFYAAHRRKKSDGAFEPSLAVATKALPGRVEIRIRDNGTGIPDAVKAKMFNPFFTTKPAGEGTGLGLSLSHDIIVKQHGGTIDVDTTLGEFTEFTIGLPRADHSAISSPRSRGEGRSK